MIFRRSGAEDTDEEYERKYQESQFLPVSGRQSGGSHSNILDIEISIQTEPSPTNSNRDYSRFQQVEADYAVKMSDGTNISVCDLVLKNCDSNRSIGCTWTDARGVSIAVSAEIDYHHEECRDIEGVFSCFSSTKNDEENWLRDRSWSGSALHSAVDVADGINHAILASGVDAAFDDQDSDETMPSDVQPLAPEPDVLSFPVYLLSDPRKAERARRTEALLRAAGLTGPLSLLPFTPADEVDMDQLRTEGLLDERHVPRFLASSWIGPTGLRPYLASAADHLRGLAAGADARHARFAVVEDDLMLAAAPAAIRARLTAALAAAPPSADMLYLEACFETCRERRFAGRYPLWARTTGADCSAAIVFSRKGARRAAALCRPAFWGIDNMYAALARAGLLEAYALVPHAFFQDGFWASGLQPARAGLPARKFGDRAVAGATHRPFALTCNDFDDPLHLAVAQLSAATPFLLRVAGPPPPGPAPAAALLVADPLCADPAAAEAAYFLEDDSDAWALAGRWPGRHGLHGAVVWLPSAGRCPPAAAEDGACTLLVRCVARGGGDGGGGGSGVWEIFNSLVSISRLQPVRRDVEGDGDFLVASFRSDFRDPPRA